VIKIQKPRRACLARRGLRVRFRPADSDRRSGELIWLNRYRNNHGTNNYAKKDEQNYPSRQDLLRGIEDGKLEPKIEH
jgi:hypothetical protein